MLLTRRNLKESKKGFAAALSALHSTRRKERRSRCYILITALGLSPPLETYLVYSILCSPRRPENHGGRGEMTDRDWNCGNSNALGLEICELCGFETSSRHLKSRSVGTMFCKVVCMWGMWGSWKSSCLLFGSVKAIRTGVEILACLVW
jgi:hypothetical protein